MNTKAFGLAIVALACACGGPEPDGGGPNNGTTNNGQPNNGTANNGGVNNGSSNNGAANNGTANNGANNGPTNNGGTNNGDTTGTTRGSNNDTTNGPLGPDTDAPFPIDRGSEADTPGTYLGLPLELVDNGAPTVTSVDGVLGVVCIGMSNSSQECGDFIDKLQRGTLGPVNSEVAVVNCAVGGNAIERWNDPANDPNLWDACIDTRLPAAGVRTDQVRVLYHKAANQFTQGAGTYPAPGSDYEAFRDNLGVFAGRVRQFFPSVQAVYTTSRSYGGFSTNPARGEPLSYEEGHALNTWLAENAAVEGVWYGWGPYIWAPDCASGVTNASGVCYDRSDYQNDGVHPAQGARDKISQMIYARSSEFGWFNP